MKLMFAILGLALLTAPAFGQHNNTVLTPKAIMAENGWGYAHYDRQDKKWYKVNAK